MIGECGVEVKSGLEAHSKWPPKTLGILTDDMRKEALGFDLGSDYGNSRDVDSRQRHFVRMLRREEDRRKLYSLLFAH